MAKICPVCNMATLQMPAEGSDEKPYCTNCRWHIDKSDFEDNPNPMPDNTPPPLPDLPVAPSATRSASCVGILSIAFTLNSALGHLSKTIVITLFMMQCLLALLAVLFGMEGLVQIRNNPDSFRGRYRAIIGIIIGSIVIALVVVSFFTNSPAIVRYTHWDFRF